MICDDNVKVFLFLAAAISCLGIDEVIEPKHLAYAHLFTSDQSAEFLFDIPNKCRDITH
jgi:hypothetical protein